MELFFASILLGLVPTSIYAFSVWRVNCWEREPLTLALGAFLWGAIPSIIFSLIGQGLLNPLAEPFGPEFSRFWSSCFSAPVTEEIFKGAGLLILYHFFRREIDSVLDGVIYGALIGLGFGAVENVFYFWGENSSQSLLQLFALRTLVFGLMHGMFTGLIGAGIAMAKFSTSRSGKVLWTVAGIGAGIFTHALHNAFCTIGGNFFYLSILGYLVGLCFFVIVILVSLDRGKRCLIEHLEAEVEGNWLSKCEYEAATSYWKRSGWMVFSIGFTRYWQRRRLVRAASKLAFRKRQAVLLKNNSGEMPGIEKSIARLRKLVKSLSRSRVVPPRLPAGSRVATPPPLPGQRRAATPPPLPRTVLQLTTDTFA